MSKQLIIAEKPSVAQDIARALGGFTKEKDYFESDDYVLSSAIGHLLELAVPEEFEVKRGFAPALESLFHQSVHLRLFLDVMQKIRSDVSRYDAHVQKQLEQLGGVLER